MTAKQPPIVCVFLNDGETYSDIVGCTIRVFDAKYEGEDLDSVDAYRTISIQSLLLGHLENSEEPL